MRRTQIRPVDFDLQRFVDAQAEIYQRVVEELREGRKRSHWMWFIFPQVAGLGSREMAQRFAISGREEAESYLRHEVLGARLKQCTALVNAVTGRTAGENSDDQKFRSSVTLFAAVIEGESVFQEALLQYFGGKADPATLARL